MPFLTLTGGAQADGAPLVSFHAPDTGEHPDGDGSIELGERASERASAYYDTLPATSVSQTDAGCVHVDVRRMLGW
jgi:hypothetical protein